MLSLQVIDSKWREHLLSMDELRDGIWTVGYSEKNPLVEYKLEGFDIFGQMMETLKQDIVEFLMKVQVKEVVEEEHRFKKIGDEYHPEVEQFGAGGIPLALSPDAPVRRHGEESKEETVITVGGVKRKKTRRSRRQ
jgi:preprotein translocase subunit SecA